MIHSVKSSWQTFTVGVSLQVFCVRVGGEVWVGVWVCVWGGVWVGDVWWYICFVLFCFFNFLLQNCEETVQAMLHYVVQIIINAQLIFGYIHGKGAPKSCFQSMDKYGQNYKYQTETQITHSYCHLAHSIGCNFSLCLVFFKKRITFWTVTFSGRAL